MPQEPAAELGAPRPDDRATLDHPAERPRRPAGHLCSVTLEVMHDPVMLGCGDTFERAAIEAWLANHDTCPWCRGATDGTLTPNAALRAAIRRWEPGAAGC